MKPNALIVLNFFKISFAAAAVFSMLVCWMFRIAISVNISTAVYPISKDQEQGYEIMRSVTNYTGGLSMALALMVILLAFVYFIATRTSDKKSKYKLLGAVIGAGLLIASIIFQEHLLRELIIRNF